MTLDRLEILQGATIEELSLFFSSPTSVPATLAILRQVKGLKKVELGGGFPPKLTKGVQELGVEVTTS